MDPLLDNAPCGFVCVADDGRIVLANATIEKMAGVERGALRGRHVDALLSAASRIFYQTHVFPTLKLQGRLNEVYVSLVDSRGGEVPVLLNATRQARGGEFVSDWAVVPMRQRNEYENEILKARRAAEEAARAKDAFLAMVSHELRSPLSAISGWAHLLLEANLDAAARQRALRSIQQNAAAQAKLVDDLLDFGRIAAGKLRLEVRPTSLDELLASAIDGVVPAIQAKSIVLEVDLQGRGARVSADADRLRQVFWNILANAMKFTPAGGRIKVRLGCDGSRAEVSVSDTGKGIAPAFLPYVFERFLQEDAAARAEGGMGLGMAITRHLVELHGGTISAASDGVGKGSTFTVRLPLVDRNEAAAATPVGGEPQRQE